MARIVLQADWRAFGANSADLLVQGPEGDLEADKRAVIAQARAALDAAEKALERPEVAQATAPIARAAQANTPVAVVPKKVEAKKKEK